MCKQILVFLGISIAIGCGESPKENQFSSGCSEGGGYSGGSSATSGDKDGGEGGSSVLLLYLTSLPDSWAICWKMSLMKES